MGGSDHDYNLVKLTLREHFIAHLLLAKITVGADKYKMLLAVMFMSNLHSFNSRHYELARRTAYNDNLVDVYFINPSVLPSYVTQGENPLDEVLVRLYSQGFYKFLIPKERRFYNQGEFYNYEKYLKGLRDSGKVSVDSFKQFSVYILEDSWMKNREVDYNIYDIRDLSYNDEVFGKIKYLRKGYCIYKGNKFLNPMKFKSRVNIKDLLEDKGVREDRLPVNPEICCVPNFISDELSIVEDFKNYCNFKRYSSDKYSGIITSLSFLCQNRLRIELPSTYLSSGNLSTVNKKVVPFICERFNYVYVKGGKKKRGINENSCIVPEEMVATLSV